MPKLTVLILGALALVAVACSSTPASTSSASGSQEIAIEANEFKFTPAAIEVAAGRPIKIAMRNKGTIEHDWSIMEIPATAIKSSAQSPMGHDMSGAKQPEVHMVAAMGQMAQMEFTPTRPGTFQFYCTVAGHKEAGMVGTLVVK